MRRLLAIIVAIAPLAACAWDGDAYWDNPTLVLPTAQNSSVATCTDTLNPRCNDAGKFNAVATTVDGLKKRLPPGDCAGAVGFRAGQWYCLDGSPPLTAITLNDVNVQAGKSAAVTGAFPGGSATDAYWYVTNPLRTTVPTASESSYGSFTSTNVYNAPAGASGARYAIVWAVSKTNASVHDWAYVNITDAGTVTPTGAVALDKSAYGSDTTTATSVSASVTTTAATDLFAIATFDVATDQTAAPTDTISASGLSWTSVASFTATNFNQGLRVYKARAATASAITVTWSPGTVGQTAKFLALYALTNVTGVGATASALAISGAPLAVSITPTRSGSYLLFGGVEDSVATRTWLSNTTALGSVNASFGANACSGYVPGSTASTAATIGTGTTNVVSTENMAVAIEVQGGEAYGVSVAVAPTGASVAVNATRSFSCTVTNGSPTTCTWAVTGTGCGSVNPTSASTTTTYTAPASAASGCAVVATSVADTSKSATATVLVTSSSGTFPPDTTTWTKLSQPAASEPALGGTITNLGTSFSLTSPAADTTTKRVIDDRHHYSKTPVWNSDESFAATLGLKILDGTTYAVLRTASGTLPNEHKTWSNTDPKYIYGAHYQNKQWIRVDATTGTGTVLKTYVASDVGLSSLSSVSYGSYEGNMDDADTGAALIANGVRPFLINPKTGAVRCYVSSGGDYGHNVSDTTMSHDGNWMIVNWSGYGKDAYRASDCGFSARLTTNTSHYDTCVSTAGRQVIVDVPGSSMKMIDIASPAGVNTGTTVLTDSALRVHISCRNIKRPGWVYVSGYNDDYDSAGGITGSAKIFHRIIAVKLDGTQTIENFAWDHQAAPSHYSDDTMACPSPTGTRVWWKSIWDGTGGVIHSYVAGTAP